MDETLQARLARAHGQGGPHMNIGSSLRLYKPIATLHADVNCGAKLDRLLLASPCLMRLAYLDPKRPFRFLESGRLAFDGKSRIPSTPARRFCAARLKTCENIVPVHVEVT